MVSFTVTPKVVMIGDILYYGVTEMDTSKGCYIIAIKDYNSFMNDYTLHQQQNVFGKWSSATTGTRGVTGLGKHIYSSSDLTTLTVFYFDTYSTNFSSLQEFEESVTLGDYTAKSETFNISIYDGKRKSGIVTWLRQWFNTKEEHDEMLLADNGWKTCTLSSGYAVYASGTTLRVKKVGKMVHATGIFKNNNTLSASSYVQFATLPSGYRPSQEQVKVCQGSDINRWLLRITADGAMTLSRYGTSSDASASSGRWLPYCITYMVD